MHHKVIAVVTTRAKSRRVATAGAAGVACAALFVLVAVCAPAVAHSQEREPQSQFLAAISVASLDSSIAWYSRNLGFRVYRPTTRPRPGVEGAVLERDGLFWSWPSCQDRSLARHRCRFPVATHHYKAFFKFALWVADLDSAAATLRSNGVPLYGSIGVDSTFAGGVRFLLVRDRDGNVIQI